MEQTDGYWQIIQSQKAEIERLKAENEKLAQSLNQPSKTFKELITPPKRTTSALALRSVDPGFRMSTILPPPPLIIIKKPITANANALDETEDNLKAAYTGLHSASMSSIGERVTYLRNHLNLIGFELISSETSLDNCTTCHTVDFFIICENVRLWRVKKEYQDFVKLYERLCDRLPEDRLNEIAPISKQLFLSHEDPAPFKTDERFEQIRKYLESTVETISDMADALETILAFLSRDLHSAAESCLFPHSLKEGHLAKKGKLFGKWTRRYYVLTSSALIYWESKDYAAICSSEMQESWKQCKTIEEMEQLEWLASSRPHGYIDLNTVKISKQKPLKMDANAAISKVVSEYRHGFMITSASHDHSNKAQKRNILCSESDYERDEWVFALVKLLETTKEPFAPVREQSLLTLTKKDSKKVRPKIFGAALSEAVSNSISRDCSLQVPSVVYRCIQYLEHEKAFQEEGLYRINGNQKTINRLMDEFDATGDIDLMRSDMGHDINEVAGLLKLYIRKLPEPLFTKRLHSRFMEIPEIKSKSDQTLELSRLISLLPIENYTVLRLLFAHFLSITKNSSQNKMNIRNIAIVFAPTLGIPVSVLSLMLVEYDLVFWVFEDDEKMLLSRPDGPNHRPGTVIYLSLADNSNQDGQMETVLPTGRKSRNSIMFAKSIPRELKHLARESTLSQDLKRQLEELSEIVNDPAVSSQ